MKPLTLGGVSACFTSQRGHFHSSALGCVTLVAEGEGFWRVAKQLIAQSALKMQDTPLSLQQVTRVPSFLGEKRPDAVCPASWVNRDTVLQRALKSCVSSALLQISGARCCTCALLQDAACVLLDGVNGWQNVLLALSKCRLACHPMIRSSLDRVETQELLFPFHMISNSTGQFSPFLLGLFQTLVGAVNTGYSCETSLLLLLSIIRRLGALKTDCGASEQLRLDAGSAWADCSVSVCSTSRLDKSLLLPEHKQR